MKKIFSPEQRLTQLKQVLPAKDTVKLMKAEIFAKVDKQQSKTGYTFSLRSLRSVQTIRYAFLALALVFFTIAVFQLLLPEQYEMTKTTIQTHLTANHYEKSRIELQLARYLLKRTNTANNQSLKTNIHYLADATAQTSSALAELKLVGEPGRYTNQQCLAIYHDYYVYLESLEKTLHQKEQATHDQITQHEISSLLSQISTTEKKIDRKLRMYDKK